MGYQIAHKVACAVSRQNGAHLLLFLSPTSENAQAREGAVEFDCNESVRREDPGKGPQESVQVSDATIYLQSNGSWHDRSHLEQRPRSIPAGNHP